MAYSRFSDSDVYIYPHVCGGIACCSCKLNGGNSVHFDTYDSAIQHIKEHEKAGHSVDEHTIYRIELDRDNGEGLEPDDDLFN